MPIVRILVVDDFVNWHSFVAEFLELEGDLKIVAVATEGLQAVQSAETLQPDVILMDINMPEMNGIEAAKKIRVLSPSSKIVFLSEASNYEFVSAAFELGGSGYILKSDSGKDLVAGIRAVLQGRRFVSRSLRDMGMG